jgi:hypothetical protein
MYGDHRDSMRVTDERRNHDFEKDLATIQSLDLSPVKM